MSAISGTRRAFKELVDGTIRVTVDVDPRFRKQFFALFPNIDMPVALAPLAKDFEQRAEPSIEPDPPKGGELARLSGRLCNDPEFQRWLELKYPNTRREVMGQNGTDSDSDWPARMVRSLCGVKSRAELDNSVLAAERFHTVIRKPFNEWSNGKEGR